MRYSAANRGWLRAVLPDISGAKFNKATSKIALPNVFGDGPDYRRSLKTWLGRMDLCVDVMFIGRNEFVAALGRLGLMPEDYDDESDAIF